jgi:hypothetical protein
MQEELEFEVETRALAGVFGRPLANDDRCD